MQAKDQVECSISDTGITIPKESINEVFERFSGFYRTPSQGGLWIDPGFSIAKRIIEKHDGKVRVESEPDKKTIFTFTLPATSVTLK